MLHSFWLKTSGIPKVIFKEISGEAFIEILGEPNRATPVEIFGKILRHIKGKNAKRTPAETYVGLLEAIFSYFHVEIFGGISG